MGERVYAVYILTNRSSKVIYVGMTGDIVNRLLQHRAKSNPGFTARYNVNRLVHIEYFDEPGLAIAREKQIKGWSRAKKIALIAAGNPKWGDLAVDMGLDPLPMD